jgi:hypothetical protein
VGAGASGELGGHGSGAPPEPGMQEVLGDVRGILRAVLTAVCLGASLLSLPELTVTGLPVPLAVVIAVALVALAWSRHREHRLAPLVLSLPAIVMTATLASWVFDRGGCTGADFATNRSTTDLERTWPPGSDCRIVAADGTVSTVTGEMKAYVSMLALGLLIGVLLAIRGNHAVRAVVAVVAGFAAFAVMSY